MLDALPAAVPAPFVLLDAVTHCDAATLEAVRCFSGDEAWQGMEAVAQAAALHQRWLAAFERHAFLLGLEECRCTEPLCGTLGIRVRLTGQSAQAATYSCELVSETGERPLSAALSVGLVPYDAVFRRERLERRYRELFQCLIRNGASRCADSSNSG